VDKEGQHVDIETLELSKRSRFISMGALALVLLLANPVLAAPGDVELKRKDGVTSGFPVAIFPHGIHRVNYRCDACHTRLFGMQAGTTETSMADINAGQSCGTCHDGEKAFAAGFQNCNRCHVPSDAE
jgi:c(7)-type cytochrome triheme protein